ncbi:HNH endonuclease [Geomonas anaerohicana]|uniref:HNH endonuclease n=1 Tax=Geomonas anaerohicana TaxID=2798583 RepID=A0ABS0YEM7_9BACT|nr:HNH endonuclease signature motif containing protein [Geomonas anaerohicana]MBJ6750745.1 HNH endonuclease [Geomonas anaerohicana]
MRNKRRCFREPIPEIYDAARYLDAAVSAHLNGLYETAENLFRLANDPKVWSWTDSIWGKNSNYVEVRRQPVLHITPREKARMPDAATKKALHERDGYHCRFCGIPVIHAKVRTFLQKMYPDAIPWGTTNKQQHAAFQCMWLQYDHVLPHSAGGENTLDNLVITCAACNFGKMEFTLEELGLFDPRNYEPVKSLWDGLVRVMKA